MKIALIVSGAEPGRDGIGDYALSLGTSLRTLGHSVLVVALNDRWISGAVTAPNPDGIELERLPSSLPLRERIDGARARLEAFRPDWASFQMCCYGYHRKGLLFGFNRHLPRLAVACENWQVMFHELWIGGTSLKHRLIGALQRHLIVRAVRILRPRLLHTSTPVFRAHLSTVGIEASVLPLTGNIPVNPDPGLDWFMEVLGEPGRPVAAQERTQHLAGGFFGTIYPEWQPEPFFSSLRTVAAKTGQRVTILSAGRMGSASEALWNSLPPAYPDFRFHRLGELPVSRVSQYLRNLDFGIAATPWIAIGKSGATAAMLDHGVPVMVTRNDVRPDPRLEIEPPADPLLILAERDVSDRFLAGLPRRAPRHSAQDLAAEFVERMERAQAAARFGG
ncbi:MAG: hypothetical protein ABI318_04480 [Chthoniobacteraceae bacterium]